MRGRLTPAYFARGFSLIGILLCLAIGALILVGSLRIYQQNQAKARLRAIQIDVAHLMNDGERFFLAHCQQPDGIFPFTTDSKDYTPCIHDPIKNTCPTGDKTPVDTQIPTKHMPWVSQYTLKFIPFNTDSDLTPPDSYTQALYKIQVEATLVGLAQKDGLCTGTAKALSAVVDPKQSGCTLQWQQLPGTMHTHASNDTWGMNAQRLQWVKNSNAATQDFADSVCAHG